MIKQKISIFCIEHYKTISFFCFEVEMVWGKCSRFLIVAAGLYWGGSAGGAAGLADKAGFSLIDRRAGAAGFAPLAASFE